MSGHQPVAVRSGTITSHLVMIELVYDKGKLSRLVSIRRPAGKESAMEALTPASPDGLPLVGELIADDPCWRYRFGAMAGEGVAHLRVWRTAGAEPGHVAVATETGSAASVTESAGPIWAELARRYGPSLVLLEHYLAPEAGGGCGDPRSGPGRRRWQSALAARVAHSGGEPSSRWTGTLDGRSRISDRRQARQCVRLVPGRGRLSGPGRRTCRIRSRPSVATGPARRRGRKGGPAAVGAVSRAGRFMTGAGSGR